jgi:hypothetical protein
LEIGSTNPSTVETDVEDGNCFRGGEGESIEESTLLPLIKTSKVESTGCMDRILTEFGCSLIGPHLEEYDAVSSTSGEASLPTHDMQDSPW